MSEVAEMVMRDASLAAQVLQTANSARFAGGREINDVLRATVRMGQDAIRRLAITLGMRQGLTVGPAAGLLSDLLKHATATAIIAQVLSQKQADWDPAICYTGGLLQNMGAIGLAAWHPKEFEGIREASHAVGFAPMEWEIDQFGISRQTVGEWLAAEWELPQEYRAAMVGQSQKDHRHGLLVELVAAAGEIASDYGLGVETPKTRPSRAEILARHDLAADSADSLPASVTELLALPLI